MALEAGVIFGILAMLGWGTADFFAAKCVKRVKSEKLYFWVQLSGLIPMFLLFILFFKIPVISLVFLILVLFAALLTLLEYVFLYKSFEYGKVSLVTPIAASYPILTVVFSVLFLNETLSFYQIISVTLILIGIILISLKINELRKLKFKMSTKGLDFAFISLLASSVLFTILGFLIKELGWFVPIFLMKIFVVIYMSIYLKTRKQKLTFTSNNLKYYIILIGLLEVFAYLMYGLGAFTFLNTIVVPISATYPLVTIILARIFFKDRILLVQWLGIFSIIAGLFIVSI